MNDIVEVKATEVISAVTREEIDMQIATAKRYPRSVNDVIDKVITYSTIDNEVADSCFYALEREDKDGEKKIIEGLSVRFAEIVASCWGNLRAITRIVGNDGRKITAQAMVHDLETNVAIGREISRSIVTKKGYTYSEDMQTLTGNAAISIAYRNAVFTVIPKAIVFNAIEKIKKISLQRDVDVENSRKNMLLHFNKLGVSKEQVFFYLGVNDESEIDKKMIFVLRGTANAIKEGITSVDETFVRPLVEATKQEASEKAVKSMQDKAAAAIAKATGNDPSTETKATKQEASEKAVTVKK